MEKKNNNCNFKLKYNKFERKKKNPAYSWETPAYRQRT